MFQNDSGILKLKRLQMPRTSLREGSNIDPAELLFENIGKIDKKNWPVGFELEMYESQRSSLCMEKQLDDCLRSLGVDYSERRYAKFKQRPSSELSAYYIWNETENGRVDVDAIRQVNRIVGGSNALRKGWLTTTRFKSGHVTQFDCASDPFTFLKSWVSEFNAPVASSLIMTKAIWLFLDLLVAHPFLDGNGRTARIMLQAYLYANGILAGPILPLGPFLQINQRSFLNAALSWELFDRPSAFFGFMDQAIRSTAIVSAKLLSRYEA